MALLNYVDTQYRVLWSDFDVVNDFYVNTYVDLNSMYVSTGMKEIMLSQRIYRMYDMNGYIGYGVGDSSYINGMTESEAYSLWIADVTDKERAFKKQLPFKFISRSQYDSLFSLFYNTGSWKRISTYNGATFDAETAIKNEQWNLVADMMVNSKSDRDHRRMEAEVLMLGDYRPASGRDRIRAEGIQNARVAYEIQTTSKILNQLEHAYYRETRDFIPGIPELKKRELIRLYGKS